MKKILVCSLFLSTISSAAWGFDVVDNISIDNIQLNAETSAMILANKNIWSKAIQICENSNQKTVLIAPPKIWLSYAPSRSGFGISILGRFDCINY
ncbi:MAG: hypothetical protein HOE90_04065 [Bacteriovoracaceae bacterium]|jgi:hypothetical protein|nr:hypothetical protein [Bacteriovoracaceae bacterium]